MAVKALVLDGDERVDELLGDLLVLRPEPVFAAVERDRGLLESGLGVDVADGGVQAAVELEVVQPVIFRVDVALDVQQERAADDHAGNHPDDENGEKDVEQIGQRLDEHEQRNPQRIPQRAARDAAGKRQATLAGGGFFLGRLFLFLLLLFLSLLLRRLCGRRRRALPVGRGRDGGRRCVGGRFRAAGRLRIAGRRRLGLSGGCGRLCGRVGRFAPGDGQRFDRLEFVFVFLVILVHPDLPYRSAA